MNVLIVDDEPLARLRLRSLLQGLPEFDVNVVAEAGDAAEALAQLHQHQAQNPVDAVLLDIRMPGLTPHEGLHLAARLRALPQPPAVIFVSAHAEHALKAFELEAVDYLTKPVRSERLRDALQRVRQRLQPLNTLQAALQDAPVLVVSDRGRVLRLPLPEVLVLKAGQKYVTLRTPGHEYVLDESLAELEQRLVALVGAAGPGGPAGAYLRIHRNALVARHAIRELALRDAAEPGEEGSDEGGGWAVRVAPLDEWLAVSRRQLAAVRAALAAGG